MNNDSHDFEQFMKRREDASRAFVNRDASPLNSIATDVSPATIFGPKGNYVEGADGVNAGNQEDAKLFEPGGESSFEILQMGANDGIGYWAGIQRATVRMQGKPQAISMTLRVSEVFRYENEEWKLVHRHADALAIKKS